MNCLVCRKNLDELTPLCADHAPAWGKFLHTGDKSIVVGELKFLNAVFLKIIGQKIIRWWVGSDVWVLHAFPKGRGKVSILLLRMHYFFTKRLVSENWLTSERLLREFTEKCKGRNAVVRHWIREMLTGKVQKIRHLRVNLAFYQPGLSKYQQYVYGYDLVCKLMDLFPDVTWIALSGFNKSAMQAAYSILDGYIRPTRHDGWPRMIEECKINDIPYYWSEDGNPDLEAMCEFVKTVKEKCYE